VVDEVDDEVVGVAVERHGPLAPPRLEQHVVAAAGAVGPAVDAALGALDGHVDRARLVDGGQVVPGGGEDHAHAPGRAVRPRLVEDLGEARVARAVVGRVAGELPVDVGHQKVAVVQEHAAVGVLVDVERRAGHGVVQHDAHAVDDEAVEQQGVRHVRDGGRHQQ